jgi:uncharacterized protein with HEPN domain
MMSPLRPDVISASRIIEDQAARLESVKSREKSRDPNRVANRALWPGEVERCLERICEAARKVGDALDAKYPEVEFSKLRQLGSVLRHDYDEIEAGMLWRSVTERLDPLERACRHELGRRRS